MGYGIIEYDKNKYKTLEYGSITTKAAEPLCVRLRKIAEDLQSIIDKYKIDEASIEDLFFNTNIKTGIQVAEARGVMLYILEKNNIKISEYTPLQVKQALVGYGRADKHQMMEMVKRLLKLNEMPKLDDTTDALAIAICHSYSYKYNKITKG
jgi:crossover junction endodeoxyribonuclease RuvC